MARVLFSSALVLGALATLAGSAGCSSSSSNGTSSTTGGAGGTGGHGSEPPANIDFAKIGSVSAPSGKGSFRFGAASAATQIEDQNPNTDWYLWTSPAPDGLAKSPFVGDASKGYTNAIADIDLLAEMHLDSYRFSMEWARIEPKRGMIDEAALQHYSDLLDALKAKGIKPMVTVHHFSNPVWVADPRDPDCKNGPSDDNLCGLGHPLSLIHI